MAKSETADATANAVSTAENPSKTVATIGAPGAMVIGGRAFKTKRWVTRTVLQQTANVPFYIHFEGPIKLSEIDPAHTQYDSVPEIAEIVNLESGEYQILIVNVVLGSELRRVYPDDGYVGKDFGVMQVKPRGAQPKDGEKAVDKRYRSYQIIELERDALTPGGASPVKEIDASGADAIERTKAARGGNKAA